jgi:hypothetical protein
MDRGIYKADQGTLDSSIQRFNDSTIQRPLLGAIGQDQCRFTVLTADNAWSDFRAFYFT